VTTARLCCLWRSSAWIQAGEVFAKLGGFLHETVEPHNELRHLRLAFGVVFGGTNARRLRLPLPHATESTTVLASV
jgi:hypothetical protein